MHWMPSPLMPPSSSWPTLAVAVRCTTLVKPQTAWSSISSCVLVAVDGLSSVSVSYMPPSTLSGPPTDCGILKHSPLVPRTFITLGKTISTSFRTMPPSTVALKRAVAARISSILNVEHSALLNLLAIGPNPHQLVLSLHRLATISSSRGLASKFNLKS